MPKATKTPPKEIHFGLQNISQATPAFIGRIRNGMNVGIIGIIPLIGDIAETFETSEKKMEVVIALIGVGLNVLSAMFGVPLTAGSVPSGDVTEVVTGNNG